MAVSGAEWWTFGASFVMVTGALAVLAGDLGKPTEVLPYPRKAGPRWDLVMWERDRLQGIAKALAAKSVAFLSSVYLALVKDEIKDALPAVFVVGILAGVAGSLLLALVFFRRAGNWARRYVANVVEQP